MAQAAFAKGFLLPEEGSDAPEVLRQRWEPIHAGCRSFWVIQHPCMLSRGQCCLCLKHLLPTQVEVPTCLMPAADGSMTLIESAFFLISSHIADWFSHQAEKEECRSTIGCLLLFLSMVHVYSALAHVQHDLQCFSSTSMLSCGLLLICHPAGFISKQSTMYVANGFGA